MKYFAPFLLFLPLFLSASPLNSIFSKTDTILKAHVNKAGDVDYTGLASNPLLNEVVEETSSLSSHLLYEASDATRFAFWINTYNVLTLKLIVDEKPEKSIREIEEPWKTPRFTVAGRKLSLDELEHEILRVEHPNALLHFGVNCASKGCPILRNEAYTAERVIPQLEEQARLFLSREANLKVDRWEKTLYLSSIFDWFKDDFTPNGGVQAFAAKYGPEKLQKRIQKAKTVQYLDYDWDLNKQEP